MRLRPSTYGTVFLRFIRRLCIETTIYQLDNRRLPRWPAVLFLSASLCLGTFVADLHNIVRYCCPGYASPGRIRFALCGFIRLQKNLQKTSKRTQFKTPLRWLSVARERESFSLESENPDRRHCLHPPIIAQRVNKYVIILLFQRLPCPRDPVVNLCANYADSACFVFSPDSTPSGGSIGVRRSRFENDWRRTRSVADENVCTARTS